MARLFRRPSDTIGFTILYWSTLFVAVAGLTAYAWDRINTVSSRQFFIQSHNIYTTANNPKMSIPDVIFCTWRVSQLEVSRGATFQRTDLNNSGLPQGYTVNTPCSLESHDAMWVVSSVNDTMDTYSANDPMNFIFTADTSDASDHYFYVFIVPREANPYRENPVIYGNATVLDFGARRNFHVGVQNAVDMYLYFASEKTYVLRSDILGLFNQYDYSATEYLSTSTAESFFHSNRTWIALWLPTLMVENHQVLATSLPDAFASWGGAVSIVFALFYVFFGSRRIAPFGLIQKFLMRESTKSNIAAVYGNWKKDKDGFYRRDSGPRMSTSSSINSFSNFRSDSDPRSARQPLQFLPSVPAIQNINFQNAGNQEHPSQEPPEQTRSAHLQQQLLHHEELVSLREQMQNHARILHHLQKHEQRFKDTETLLKEFYFDMDLVDTNSAVPDAASMMFEPNTPSVGQSTWIQRLFETAPESTKIKGFDDAADEETTALKGAAYSLAGHDQAWMNVSSPGQKNKGSEAEAISPFQMVVLNVREE
ncbi:hypothetical protein EDD21DRAFT_380858 [Dissophora ornata]|nr:hypothetical protein EDD21DRAFT_380858 [Dissophora ornata]